MEKEMNTKEPLHRDCAPHDAAHCDINDHHNNAKNGFDAEADDCGHTVQSGPGVGIPKRRRPSGRRYCCSWVYSVQR